MRLVEGNVELRPWEPDDIAYLYGAVRGDF
jgi:hypothetical protein